MKARILNSNLDAEWKIQRFCDDILTSKGKQKVPCYLTNFTHEEALEEPDIARALQSRGYNPSATGAKLPLAFVSLQPTGEKIFVVKSSWETPDWKLLEQFNFTTLSLRRAILFHELSHVILEHSKEPKYSTANEVELFKLKSMHEFEAQSYAIGLSDEFDTPEVKQLLLAMIAGWQLRGYLATTIYSHVYSMFGEHHPDLFKTIKTLRKQILKSQLHPSVKVANKNFVPPCSM